MTTDERKEADWAAGETFDDHGELARWLGNEPAIMVCGEPRRSKDLLEWDAGRLFMALALGNLARAIRPAPAPAPLPCPFCGGNATTYEHWTECEVCDTSWPNLYANRRAPCPECARLTVLCADQNDTNRQAARSLREAKAALALAKLDADSLANGLKEQQARAEAAEARASELEQTATSLLKRAEAAEARCLAKEHVEALRKLAARADGLGVVYLDPLTRAAVRDAAELGEKP